MAEIKSESVADFIPESPADFPRNMHLAGKRLSSVQRFSLIVGFENSLVGNPANRSAGARPG